MDTDELDTATLALLLAQRLRERVISSPASTLAGAAAVGYVIGWSMPSALYRTVASMGLRAVALQVVPRLLGLYGGDDESDLEDDLDLSSGMSGSGSSVHSGGATPYVAQ